MHFVLTQIPFLNQFSILIYSKKSIFHIQNTVIESSNANCLHGDGKHLTQLKQCEICNLVNSESDQNENIFENNNNEEELFRRCIETKKKMRNYFQQFFMMLGTFFKIALTIFTKINSIFNESECFLNLQLINNLHTIMNCESILILLFHFIILSIVIIALICCKLINVVLEILIFVINLYTFAINYIL